MSTPEENLIEEMFGSAEERAARDVRRLDAVTLEGQIRELVTVLAALVDRAWEVAAYHGDTVPYEAEVGRQLLKRHKAIRVNPDDLARPDEQP